MGQDPIERLRREDAPDLIACSGEYSSDRPVSDPAGTSAKQRMQALAQPARSRMDPYERLAMPHRADSRVVARSARGDVPTASRASYLATTDKNWMAIVSLVASLVVAAPIGILFGHLALNAESRGEANNSGVAMVGLVIGYLSILVGVLWLTLS